MSFDVRYLNRAGKAVGLATDSTTTTKRDALQRVHDLGRYGIPAHVVDRAGNIVTIGTADTKPRRG
jgi:hypothetical protein